MRRRSEKGERERAIHAEDVLGVECAEPSDLPQRVAPRAAARLGVGDGELDRALVDLIAPALLHHVHQQRAAEQQERS